MLRLDLGCGSNKEAGFLGVDRVNLPGVDVVTDLNSPLPFESDSVDLVYASHSLEHVSDLMATMREIYRICKHGAQVCIVAPYGEQKLNLANPYHIAVFNEHTPRFWSDYPHTPVEAAEYAHPHAEKWGLARSDNSDAGMDFRLVQLEFFYFPPYRHIPVERQRVCRRERLDVCDQIMYHLIAWKGDGDSQCPEYDDMVAAFRPFIPYHVAQRRVREREESFRNDTIEHDRVGLEHDEVFVKEGSSPLSSSDAEGSIEQYACTRSRIENQQVSLDDPMQANEEMKSRIKALEDDCGRKDRLIEKLGDQLVGTQAENAKKDQLLLELMSTNSELRSRIESNELLKAKMVILRAELESVKGVLAWHKAREEESKEHLAEQQLGMGSAARQIEAAFRQAKHTIDDLCLHIANYRSSRSMVLAALFSRSDPLWETVSPAFSHLKAYSAKHFRKSRLVRLVLGDDLRGVTYREYVMPIEVRDLSAISLAVCPLIPSSGGCVGVEIVTREQRVVAQTSVMIAGIRPEVPTEFVLPQCLPVLEKHWRLRVFVRDVDVPVALFEFVRVTKLLRLREFLPLFFLK